MNAWKAKFWSQRIIVCGTGPSIAKLPQTLPDGVVTIGVNDIWRHWQTRFLCILDDPGGMPEGKKAVVMESMPEAFFIRAPTHLKWQAAGLRGKIVPVDYREIRRGHDGLLPTYTGADLHACGMMSPMVAAALAVWLGASSVGIIGVDLHGHANFAGKIEEVDDLWRKLQVIYGRFVNLSELSAVTSLKKLPLHRWLKDGQKSHQ